MNSMSMVQSGTSEAKFCLATVTTDGFVPGTLVTLHSFLRHNRWFHGDVVIIHDHLDPTYSEYFERISDRVRFLQVSPELESRVQRLVTHRPDIRAQQAQFYSLETFGLRGYDKVLFCDSDLLFRRSVHELFLMDQPLICGGDGPHYAGGGRDRSTFARLPATATNGDGVLRDTFNAGFLLIDRVYLDDSHFAGLLALLSEATWARITERHTDQVVYNHYFAGQQRLVGCEYNYLLMHRALLYQREGIRVAEASVLHYNGRGKPWLADRMLRHTQQDPALIGVLKFWYDDYIECLQLLHLRTRFPDPLERNPTVEVTRRDAE